MNWTLLTNSLLVAGATTVAAGLVGACAALCAAGLGVRWRRVILVLAVIGLAFPPFLVVNCWLDLLGRGGLWRQWLPVDIYTLPGTVWILMLLLWPITFLFTLASLQRLQPSQLESEPALHGWPLIGYLVWPMILPALRQAGVLTFVLALNNFAVPAILQTKVFPAEVWVNFNTTFDYGAVWRTSWPLLALPLLVGLWFRRGEVRWPRTESSVAPRLFRRRIGMPWYGGAVWVTVVVGLLGVALPLGELAFNQRTWLELPGSFAAGRSAISNSFFFAGAGAGICVLSGLSLWRWRAGALLWVAFLVPGVLLGIVLIWVLNRGWLAAFYQSAGIVLLALGLRYAALGWTSSRQAMLSLDRRLSDFAKLHGARGWHLLRHVHWPQIASEICALWFITYLLCLWDVETLVLIIPPGSETLALRIFNLLHYGHNTQVNALCLILLGLAVAPLLAWAMGKCRMRNAECGMRSGFRSPDGGGWGRLSCVVLATALLAGCAPPSGNEAAVKSKLFGKVVLVGGRGTALGQFNKPRSVAVDAQDNLYVVDMTGRVQKFSPDGVYLLSWQMPQTDKGKPKGMCRDHDGNIIVVEPHYNRVNHFTPTGKLVAQWGMPGTNTGQLCLPRAVAVNSHGDILVCEYTQVDRVQQFSADGQQWKRAFGRSGLHEGELNRPEGLAVDSQDQVYVADSCNHRIQVFSPQGKFLRAYGHAGSGPGELSYPYDIQIDRAGFQFVSEFGNSRVQIFDPQGRSVEILGGPGPVLGQFSNPWSLALDSAGNLYVADSQNHRVQKFVRKSSGTAGLFSLAEPRGQRDLAATARAGERPTSDHRQ